jgi:DNA-binding transcriptional ArsR family regulator
MTSVFEAIADPTRRQIVELVSTRELPAGDIASAFAVSRPAISRHLRVLRAAGVLAARGDGQRRIYRLEPKALDELDAWIDKTRHFWAQHLQELDKHLQRSSE